MTDDQISKQLEEKEPNEDKLILIDEIIDLRKSQGSISDDGLVSLFDTLYEKDESILKMIIVKYKKLLCQD